MAGLVKLYRNRFNPPFNPTTSFTGRTILITGANVGLGLEAASKFVALGASSLILGVRNLEKGNRAKADIEARTKRSDVVKVWQVDMNSFQSVKAFAEKVNKEVATLDVAELNAGLLNRTYSASPEGWEETLQVNLLSTALLALLLLPKLRASKTEASTPYLAFVSSGIHRIVKPEKVVVPGSVLEHLNQPDGFAGQPQYGASKLLLQYVMREIADLTREPGGNVDVIVDSLCPGMCKSDLGRQYDAWYERIGAGIFFWLFARSTEEGSRTLVSAVTRGEEAHGKFWQHDTYPDSGPLVGTEEGNKLQAKVWREILDVLKVPAPEIEQIVAGQTK